jgi:hypothetical protein
MKSLLIAAAAATLTYGAAVSAGEDSTDRFGQAGNGVQIWSTNCGLIRFQGQTGNRDERRPCGRHGVAYDATGNLLPTAAGPGSTIRPAAPVVDRAERDEK